MMKLSRNLERILKVFLVVAALKSQKIYASTFSQIADLKEGLKAIPADTLTNTMYNNNDIPAETHTLTLISNKLGNTEIFYQIPEDSTKKEVIGVVNSDANIISCGSNITYYVTTSLQPESIYYTTITASRAAYAHLQSSSTKNPMQNMKRRRPTSNDQNFFNSMIEAALEKLLKK